LAALNVNLSDDLAAFVDEQVHNGRHQNASEVVGEALRRYASDLAAKTERIDSIRGAIREGREAISRDDFSQIARKADEKALLSRLIRPRAKPKPYYTLEELLEGSDYSEPQTPEDREWVDSPAVGREII